MAQRGTILRVLQANDNALWLKGEKDLIKFFCNNVFLGQWELAKTVIPLLCKLQQKQKSVELDIVDTIIRVCQYPFPQSLGSKTIPTPHHLSWLCYQELKQICLSEQKEAHVNHLSEDIDFRMTLFHLGDVDQNVLEELYICFQKQNNVQSVQPSPSNDSSNVSHTTTTNEFLSKECIDVIKTTILACPSLGDSLVTALMTDKGRSDSRENELLQGLFIDCMLTLLDELESDEGQSDTKKGPDDVFDKVLVILSFYDPVPYWNYLQLRKLFSRLVTLVMNQEQEETGQSLIEEIVSLISGRQNSYLLDEFTKVYLEISDRTTFKKLGPELVTLTEKQKFHLKLLTLLDRNICWRDFFVLCYKRKTHFLGEVLDLSLSLVKAELFMELNDLLSFPEFHPLKAVVLLMGWSYCRSSSQARTLLETLWQDKIENPNALFVTSCRKLAYNLDLIHWCLERAGPLLDLGNSSSGRQASELLQSLETHSVLYMLHHSTNLGNLDAHEVLHLLSNISTDKRKEGNKKRSVTFQDEVITPEKEPVNVEQQKDIAIFKSYCAIKNVMEAILFCVDKFEHKLLNPVQVKRAIKVKSLYKSFTTDSIPSSSEGEDSCSSPERSSHQMCDDKESADSFPKAYKQSVTTKLMKVREHLSTLQPLPYRLEVIEDIYSLLFLTHEDLTEQEDPEVDSDQDDEDSKQSSVDNMNSLNASLISDDDPADDPVVEKLPKVSTKKSEKLSTLSGPGVSSGQSYVDYDEPFIDPKQNGGSLPSMRKVESELHHYSGSKESYENKEQGAQTVDKSSSYYANSNRGKRRHLSTCSDIELFNSPIGYLLSDYPVRDILLMLKDSISDLSSARYTLIQMKKFLSSGKSASSSSHSSTSPSSPLVNLDVEEALQEVGLSMVKDDSFGRRLTKITQAVHESWWRFQLVSHMAIPKQPGFILTEPVQVTENDVSFLLTEVHLLPPQTAVIASSGPDEPPSPHRRSRRFFSSNIISRMMASPESLLVFSLIKNKISQAAEVIKLFHINEKIPEVSEVEFAELFIKSAETLWQLEKDTKELSPKTKKVGKRNVKALAKAASAGVASASLSNIVEDLVTSSTIPSVPKLKTPFVRKHLSSLFNIDCVAAVLLDLLFTSCRTWDTCNTMLDIIKTKTKLLDDNDTPVSEGERDGPSPFEWRKEDKGQEQTDNMSAESTTPPRSASNFDAKMTSKAVRSGINGYTDLLWIIVDMINQAATSDSSSSIIWPPIDNKNVDPHLGRVSIQHHLHTTCASIQLSYTNHMDKTVSEIKKSVDRVLLTMNEGAGGGGPVAVLEQLDIPAEEGSSRTSSPRGSLSGSLAGNLPTPRKWSKSGNQSAMLLSFRHLIHTMEKLVPGEGILQLLLSKTSKVTTPPQRNFLLSLYEHVKEMANLVAECEGMSKDFSSNLFKVLEDGPVSVLGRLMFVKKMQPARLETVAEKLSLNLTHTIVHSCCPKIPCKHPKYSSHYTGNDGAVVSDLEGQHPEEIVRSILTSLHHLMESFAIKQNAKGIFDSSCGVKVVDTEEYKEVIKSTSLLKDVDLEKLQTPEQKICFFVNLTNLMVIHTHLTHIQIRSEMATTAGPGEFDFLFDEICPFTAMDNLAFSSILSYKVGQMGSIRSFDLLNIICRAGMKAPSKWKDLLSCFTLVLQPDDPWCRYSPPMDPRLTFALIWGCASSPPLQILHPDTAMEQLDSQMISYLSHTVTISMEDEKVWIPELLTWYEQDFVSEKEYATNNHHAALIQWVCNNVNEDKKLQIQSLFLLDRMHGFSENIDVTGKYELPFGVETDLFVHAFSISFDISHVHVDGGKKTSTPLPLPMKQTNKQFRWSNSMELSGHGISLQLPSYNLTPATLEYVKHDSLLVATMVSLVCADNFDNIAHHFKDDYFNMPGQTPKDSNDLSGLPRFNSSSSDISLVDIRSYRYHRLMDDYPILQRHLLHYMLPLAGADNPELLESREPILKFVTNEIDDQVKLCMFSLATSEQYQRVIQDMTNRLVEDKKWIHVLNIVQSLPEHIIREKKEIQAMHDFVLACWAMEQADKPGQAPKVGDSLRKFYSPDFQARTVMSIHSYLPLDLSIDILQCSMDQLDPSTGLWMALDAIHKQSLLFQQIVDSMDQLRIKFSLSDLPVTTWSAEDQNLYKILDDFTDWKRMAKRSITNPENILLILEKTSKFDTATEWAMRSKLSPDILKRIRQAHLVHLLTLKEPDTVQAFQLLDSVRSVSETDCLSMCQCLIETLSNPHETKFLLNYILEYLTDHLLPEGIENVKLQRIGATALMRIPVSMRGEYSHLISCPHLIMEQLIMNMKAELAGQIFEEIKHDFVDIKEIKMRMAHEQFNELLVNYAKKSLEITVVYVQDRSRRDSLASFNSGQFDENEFLASTRRSADRRRIEPSVSPTPSSNSSFSSRHEKQQTTKSSPSKGSRFIMPAQPPSKDQWMPDDATAVCTVCKVEQFSMFNRRHHCRRCGRVVCAACSTRQTVVFGVLTRTCDECYEQINSLGDMRADEEHEIYSQRIKERLSGVGGGSPTGRGSPSSDVVMRHGAAASVPSPYLHFTMNAAIHHANRVWKLQMNMAATEDVRTEFYYEQSPSVALCISLLKQHSSRLEAGKLILNLCDMLSAHLVPLSPGVPNPEIDYSLIVSHMRQLLFQAKFDFVQSGDSGMIGQCDMYLTRVDLLKTMVEANYKDLPTIKELTKQDSVRRLRDKLIADERLSLAMEVSTKCGLDPSGVWSVMGYTCLQTGNFQGARDKFSHCFKVPSDKNQTASSQSRTLGELLEFLDSMPSSGLTEIQMLMSKPESICDINTLLIPSVGEENRVDSLPYKECLFYLRTYGSFADHISFLLKHGYWMKAVQFTLDHHCSSDVFVHAVMKPALESGELGRLLEQMLMLDPTLTKWIGYLTATCRHLLKVKYFHTLYQVQLFMKDFIRAAMTCISHFYQRGARDYLDLCGRLHYLFTAQQHLQAYLDPGQWGSVPHPLVPVTPNPGHFQRPPHSWEASPPQESSTRMTLTPDKVKRHIRLVALQIEVTRFLEQCLTQAVGDTPAAYGPKSYSGSAQIPTLFGEMSARTELVATILLCGDDFGTSFKLAVRIIKECGLNTTVIFTHCSREMANQGRCGEMSSLIQALIADDLVSDEAIDEIVGASLLVIADSQNQAKDESDSLIQLLRNDNNKINAYILCGKLRSAYLLAVKKDSIDDVQRIAGAAQRLGQPAVKNICKKWLEQHKK